MSSHRSPARPGTADIHLWRIRLTANVDRLIASLSTPELQRLGRCHGDRRMRFAISHGAMRDVLSDYLDCTPAAVPLRAEYGRAPSVPGLWLSLAHCDRLALLAVSGAPVGVDVEAVEDADDEDLLDLAEATLAPAELRRFCATPAADQPRSWLWLWVRKEAALKARGEGLADRCLRDLDVSNDRVEELTLADIDIGAGHLAATASRASNVRISLKEWTDESR
jgi:4'-phosphopantetheinyl transferase